MTGFRIGVFGNIPLPNGGVATTCLNIVKKLIGLDQQVSLLDGYPNSQKHHIDGLVAYQQTNIKKRLPFLILSFFKRFLLEFNFRTYLWYFIRNVSQLKLKTVNLKWKIKMLLLSIEALDFFSGKNIDIFWSQHALTTSFAALILARYYFKRPIVVTLYTSEFTMESNKVWLKLAIQVCNEADAIICISEYACQRMLEAGAKPRFTSMIHLGIDAIHFAIPEPGEIIRVREQYQLAENRHVILYTGHLVERKGPQVLLEALPKIKSLTWDMVFLGPDHGEKNNLLRRAKTLGLEDRIRIPGEIPFSDLLIIYDIAYVFVFPTLSKDEGFGLVALEAMAHSTPVIASYTGAIPEVVTENETGFFFLPGDSESLSDLLQTILTNEGLRNQLAESARKRAMQFSWDKCAAQFMSVFTEIIKSSHA